MNNHGSSYKIKFLSAMLFFKLFSLMLIVALPQIAQAESKASTYTACVKIVPEDEVGFTKVNVDSLILKVGQGFDTMGTKIIYRSQFKFENICLDTGKDKAPYTGRFGWLQGPIWVKLVAVIKGKETVIVDAHPVSSLLKWENRDFTFLLQLQRVSTAEDGTVDARTIYKFESKNIKTDEILTSSPENMIAGDRYNSSYKTCFKTSSPNLWPNNNINYLISAGQNHWGSNFDSRSENSSPDRYKCTKTRYWLNSLYGYWGSLEIPLPYLTTGQKRVEFGSGDVGKYHTEVRYLFDVKDVAFDEKTKRFYSYIQYTEEIDGEPYKIHGKPVVKDVVLGNATKDQIWKNKYLFKVCYKTPKNIPLIPNLSSVIKMSIYNTNLERLLLRSKFYTDGENICTNPEMVDINTYLTFPIIVNVYQQTTKICNTRSSSTILQFETGDLINLNIVAKVERSGPSAFINVDFEALRVNVGNRITFNGVSCKPPE